MLRLSAVIPCEKSYWNLNGAFTESNSAEKCRNEFRVCVFAWVKTKIWDSLFTTLPKALWYQGGVVIALNKKQKKKYDWFVTQEMVKGCVKVFGMLDNFVIIGLQGSNVISSAFRWD